MAVKKSTAKKSSAPKTKPKSAVKKAAPKKSVKKASPKKASQVKAKPKVKAAAPKKVVKKASPVKLTDSQEKLLSTVSQAPSPGYLGNKAEAKALASLLQKRLLKTGKKEGGFFRYAVTKLGEKYIPKAASPAPSVETVPAASAPAEPASPPPTS